MESNWIEFWDSLPPGTHYAIYVIAGLAMAGLYVSSPIVQAWIDAFLQWVAATICALLRGVFQVLRDLWRMLFK